MKSSIRAALNKALKTDDISHRVVNHMLLALKHDIDDDLHYCGCYHGASTLNYGIASAFEIDANLSSSAWRCGCRFPASSYMNATTCDISLRTQRAIW